MAEYPGVSGIVNVRVMAGSNLLPMDRGKSSDPYVVVSIPNAGLTFTTDKVKKTLNPVWAEEDASVTFGPFRDATVLSLVVEDWNRIGKPDPMGSITVPMSQLPFNDTVILDLPVVPPSGVEVPESGAGTLKVQFSLCEIPADILPAHASLPPLETNILVPDLDAPVPDSGIESAHTFGVCGHDKNSVVFTKGTPLVVAETFVALIGERLELQPTVPLGLLSGSIVVAYGKAITQAAFTGSFLAAASDAALLHGYRLLSGMTHSSSLGALFSAITSPVEVAYPALVITLDAKTTLRASSVLASAPGLPGVIGASLTKHGIQVKTEGGLRFKESNKSWKCDLKSVNLSAMKCAPNDIAAVVDALRELGFALEAVVGVRNLVFRPYMPGFHHASCDPTRVGVNPTFVVMAEKQAVTFSGNGSATLYDACQTAMGAGIEIKATLRPVNASEENAVRILTFSKVNKAQLANLLLNIQSATVSAVCMALRPNVVRTGSSAAFSLHVGMVPETENAYMSRDQLKNPVLYARGTESVLGGLESQLEDIKRHASALGLVEVPVSSDGMGGINQVAGVRGFSFGLGGGVGNLLAAASMGGTNRIMFNKPVFQNPLTSFSIAASIAAGVRDYVTNLRGNAEGYEILSAFHYFEKWSYRVNAGVGRNGQSRTVKIVVKKHHYHAYVQLGEGGTEGVVFEPQSFVEPPPSYVEGVDGKRFSMADIEVDEDDEDEEAHGGGVYDAGAAAASSSAAGGGAPPPLPPGWVETYGPDGGLLYLFTPTNAISKERPPPPPTYSS